MRKLNDFQLPQESQRTIFLPSHDQGFLMLIDMLKHVSLSIKNIFVCLNYLVDFNISCRKSLHRLV